MIKLNKQKPIIIATVAVFALIILCSTASADTRLFGTFGAGSYSEGSHNDPNSAPGLYYHSGYDGIGYVGGTHMYGQTWGRVQKTVYFNEDCNVDVQVHSSWSGTPGDEYLRLYVNGSPVGSDWLLTGGFYHTWSNVSFTEGNRVVALQFGTSNPYSVHTTMYYVSNQHWEFYDLTLLNDKSLVYGVVTDQDNVVIQSVAVNVGGYEVTTDSIGYYQVIVNDSDTYSVSASKTGYTDYSGSVTVSTSDVEKNIQLQGPTLSNITILSTTDNLISIGWDLDNITDTVKVYRDTNTNLIGQSTGTLYTDSNLAPGTSYDYWLEPWVGASSGSKYPISGNTKSGGGPGPDPTPQPTPQPTSYPEPDHGGGSVFIGDVHITIPDFFSSPLWIIAIFMLLSLAIVTIAAEHGKKK